MIIYWNIFKKAAFKFFPTSTCTEPMNPKVSPSKRHCYCQLFLISLSFQKETVREKEQ